MTFHRMTWMCAPTFTFFHDLSAVYTGAFKASPSAKQARSPRDKPSGRVCATRSPASLACSEVKGTASRMGRRAASHASLGRRPADEFAVHFSQIDGADGRGAQELGRQRFGSGLLIEKGEQGGSVQNNSIHFVRPRGVRQAIRPRERCPASRACGPAAERARYCASRW